MKGCYKFFEEMGNDRSYNELVCAVTMVDDGTYSSERERQLPLNGVIYSVIKKLQEYVSYIASETSAYMGDFRNAVL